MRKLLIIITLAITPFLLVWTAFLLTAFSFNAVQVFQGGSFWFISVIYWIMYLCMIGIIIDGVDHSQNNKI